MKQIRPRSARKPLTSFGLGHGVGMPCLGPAVTAVFLCEDTLDQARDSCHSNCRPRAGDSRGWSVCRPSGYGLLPAINTSSARHASPKSPR